MGRRSLIDDVKHRDEVDELGPPILFENANIRRMLQLAEAGKDDTFYDLGSGWGQNLFVAASEFDVRRAVGIEADEGRYRKSVQRRKRWLTHYPNIAKRIEIVQADFIDLIRRGDHGGLKDATVVFLGLDESAGDIEGLTKLLQDGCRLVYYNDCLIPEIMPDKCDYPFFLSTKPFRRPKSELEWLSSVVQKHSSSLHGGKPDATEMWDELSHDFRLSATFNLAPELKKRLKKIL